MGEYADMMIEGDLCSWCGSFIDDDDKDADPECGVPRLCGDCARDAAQRGPMPSHPPQRKKKKRRRR
jgi:hypothetical protein